MVAPAVRAKVSDHDFDTSARSVTFTPKGNHLNEFTATAE